MAVIELFLGCFCVLLEFFSEVVLVCLYTCFITLPFFFLGNCNTIKSIYKRIACERAFALLDLRLVVFTLFANGVT
ncbi:hypothetical protein AS219_01525 [Neorickettsia sp. 179522]|nr:hypothetical protein AS219_01525 [Neorickettsia sp. 179522]